MTITTLAQVEAALIAWLATVLPNGMQAIFENQNAPRPGAGVQYVSLFGPRVIRETEVDQQAQPTLATDTTVTFDSAFQYGIFVTFSTHCDTTTMSAFDLALQLHRAMQEIGANIFFDPLAVIDVDEIQQLPETLEDQFEARCEFTVQFRLGMEDSTEVPAIREVDVAGTVTGGVEPRTLQVKITGS